MFTPGFEHSTLYLKAQTHNLQTTLGEGGKMPTPEFILCLPFQAHNLQTTWKVNLHVSP